MKKSDAVVFFGFMALGSAVFLFFLGTACDSGQPNSGEVGRQVIDMQETVVRLREHVHELTVTIGERSIRLPENLEKTAAYIESFHRGIDIPVRSEPYRYRDFTVANIIAKLDFSSTPAKHYLLGAHYDSVWGTVGADDNASAIAVQLEVARRLRSKLGAESWDLGVEFVSFALEEPPAFGTRHMGSKIHAKNAKKKGERIDGMLCLEMVGYTCQREGCQGYPFPLMFMKYPKKGNFIGIVGNLKSRGLTSSLFKAFQKNRKLPAIKLTVPFGGWIMPSVRLSDHAPFWDQGYRAVMITDSAFYRNPHYHMDTDTMDQLDFEFMAELVESLVIFFEDVGSRR